MTVYVVLGHDYHSNWPEGVYTSEHLALSHINAQEEVKLQAKTYSGLSWSMEPWILDDFSKVGNLYI